RGEQQIHPGPVLPDPFQIHPLDPFAPLHPLHHLPELIQPIRRHGGELLPENLSLGPTERLRRRRIPQYDATLEIQRQDRHRRGLDDRLQFLRRAVQRLPDPGGAPELRRNQQVYQERARRHEQPALHELDHVHRLRILEQRPDQVVRGRDPQGAEHEINGGYAECRPYVHLMLALEIGDAPCQEKLPGHGKEDRAWPGWGARSPRVRVADEILRLRPRFVESHVFHAIIDQIAGAPRDTQAVCRARHRTEHRCTPSGGGVTFRSCHGSFRSCRPAPRSSARSVRPGSSWGGRTSATTRPRYSRCRWSAAPRSGSRDWARPRWTGWWRSGSARAEACTKWTSGSCGSCART